MSLRGTLRDFTLSELLQMIALAGKSGVVEVVSPTTRAWIGIRDGAIVRVARDDMELEWAGEGADPDARALRALIELLAWTDGDFTLYTREEAESGWPLDRSGFHLDDPLSIQFLALEAVRLAEDAERERPAQAQEATLEACRPAVVPPAERGSSGPPPRAGSLPRPVAVVVIDRDLALLESIKAGLAPCGVPVHILQNSADGLSRVRQYLRKAQIPAAVLGKEVVDPIEPRRKPGWAILARRVRALAPGMRVVLLSADAPASDSEVTDVVPLPSAPELTHEDITSFLQTLTEALGLGA